MRLDCAPAAELLRKIDTFEQFNICLNSEIEVIYVCIYHSLEGCRETYICRNNDKIFDSAKFMVDQKLYSAVVGEPVKREVLSE